MYYPPSEITPNLYTSGFELVYSDTRKPYTGYYYKTSDGKYYEGKNYTPKAKELKKAVVAANNVANSPSVASVLPGDSDYERGYMIRFVVKRVNSGPESIMEVDQNSYIDTIKNPLYTQADFKWYISGPIEDVDTIAGYKIPGVISKNSNSLLSIEGKIPGASKFFKNLVQYYK